MTGLHVSYVHDICMFAVLLRLVFRPIFYFSLVSFEGNMCFINWRY